ncbi:MAG: 50S ribosomal protein L6 [Phycisphaeraceae bacterium]
MSRIGKKPVAIAGSAKVSVAGRQVTVEAGSNRLSITHPPEVRVRVDDGAKEVVVERENDSRRAKAMHGLTRSLIANMIEGVTVGYAKDLEINGVGWNAQLQGRTLNLNVGYADTRSLSIPAGLEVTVQQNKIRVAGPDKQAVGQFAAVVRSQRPPEPYNSKGIKYADEVIVTKQGKAFGG